MIAAIYKKMEKKKVYELDILESGRFGIKAISLVDKPAIEEEWVALKSVELQEVDTERRMIYGAALIPDKKIKRVRDNGEEYFIKFSKDTIEKSAHRFFIMNNHHNATYQHKDEVKGVVFVESWLKESEQDKSAHFGYDLPIGTWFVGAKIMDDDLWKKVKAGEVRGWSIEGIYIEKEIQDIELAYIIDELIEEFEKV